ncbi:MAG: hypothetical protein R3324_06200 [Halobacteriales archaeon]|nr:hypothetical protein [Halobacteriales archaeon]
MHPSELGDPGAATDPASLGKIVSRFQDAGLSLEILEGDLHPGYEMTGRVLAIGDLRGLLEEPIVGLNVSQTEENP